MIANIPEYGGIKNNFFNLNKLIFMTRKFLTLSCLLGITTLFFSSCSDNDNPAETTTVEINSVSITNAGESGNSKAEGILDGDTFRIKVSPLTDLKNAKLEIIASEGTVTTPASGSIIDFEANEGKQALVASKGLEIKKYGIKVTKGEYTDELAVLGLNVKGVYNPEITVSHSDGKINLSFTNVLGTKAILSDFKINPLTATISSSNPEIISNEEGDYMEVDFSDNSEKYITIANGGKEKKYVIVASIVEAGIKPSTAKIVLDQSLGSGLNPILGKNSTRGAFFDGRYAFFASREGGNNIYYYDIQDATKEMKSLQMGEGIIDIASATWAVSDVRVADNGGIYVCSMANEKNKKFIVYYWKDVNATPEKLIEYSIDVPVTPSTAVRLGDALSIIGDPKTNGYIATSNFPFQNTQQGQFYVWESKNGQINQTPKVIDLVGKYQAPSSADLSLGQYARINGIPGDNTHFIATGSAAGTLILNQNFDVEFEVERDTPIQGRAMDPHFFEYNGVRYLTYTVNREWAANDAFVEIVALVEGDNYVEGLKAISEKSIDDIRVYKQNITANATGGAAWVSACNSVKVVNDKVYVFGYVCEYGGLVIELGK